VVWFGRASRCFFPLPATFRGEDQENKALADDQEKEKGILLSHKQRLLSIEKMTI
jgi:hypothetical protein